MTRSSLSRSGAALVAALAVAGCADLLGVEDVEESGSGGGGGASPDGAGAGLPATTAPSSGAEATTATSTATATTGDSTAETTTTGDATSVSASSSSSGGGSSCGTVLPACAAAVPSTFDTDADLDLGFDRDGDSDEIDSAGGMLELEPRDGDDDDDGPRYAAVKSKSAIAAPPSGACAVWVTLVENGTDIEPSLAIGPGTPYEDVYRLERRGAVIAAQVDGADVAQVPYVKDVTRLFRIWLDSAGQVGFDVSTDGTCWTAVGNPMSQTAAGGLVRLHAEGSSGKAKLENFCL